MQLDGSKKSVVEVVKNHLVTVPWILARILKSGNLHVDLLDCALLLGCPFTGDKLEIFEEPDALKLDPELPITSWKG